MKFNAEQFYQLKDDVDLVKLVQKVYSLSEPLGMGFLHYVEGPLDAETAETFVKTSKAIKPYTVLNLEYVKGRSCKFHVYLGKDIGSPNAGGLYIHQYWNDHQPAHMRELLREFGTDAAQNHPRSGG